MSLALALPPLLIASVLVTSCGGDAAVSSPEIVDAPRVQAAPQSTDRGERCVDLSLDVRVCWDEHCPQGVCVSTPTWPALHSDRGYVCEGMGAERRCVDRAREAGPFLCVDGHCVQRYARMPSDGEWDCVELDGVALCHGGGASSGFVMAPPRQGFSCGVRRGHPEEQVCVDFFPETPPAAPGRGWRCSFEHTHQPRRRCDDAEPTPRFGDRCADAASCPIGLCVSGRCVPRRPILDCLFDADCGDGLTCELGSCRERP